MIELWDLQKANRLRIGRAFNGVPRVDLSIDCVIEGQMGRAFVDDPASPAAIKLAVGPFCYCAGDPCGPGGQELLAAIAPYSLLMPSTPGWVEAAHEMYGRDLLALERYTFSGEDLSLERLDRLIEQSPYRNEVRPMDGDFAARLWGGDHFVDLTDYDSPADFGARGAGFYLEGGGAVIGAAYASLVCSKGIEVSVYVEEAHRRCGVATVLCAHLLRWALERGLAANWDAANPESCQLAHKLGYQPAGTYLAYYHRG